MVREGTRVREFFYISIDIYSNKLPYLKLITVLVYRNSPPKSHEQDYFNF